MKFSTLSKDELIQRVSERYGSLTNPSFHWVQEEYERDRYRPLRTAVEKRFEVEDVTDLNSDVSFAYELRSKAHPGAWTLRLSMVGPYAVIIRHEPIPPSSAIVDGPGDVQTEEERLIVDMCELANCAVLPFEILSAPVLLRLFATDLDRVRLYQALFSDVDFIPGEYERSTIV